MGGSRPSQSEEREDQGTNKCISRAGIFMPWGGAFPWQRVAGRGGGQGLRVPAGVGATLLLLPCPGKVAGQAPGRPLLSPCVCSRESPPEPAWGNTGLRTRAWG